MKDARIEKLAHNLVNFSCRLKQGEKVLVEAYDDCEDLVKAIVKEAYAVGAMPFVWMRCTGVLRAQYIGATQEQLKLMAKNDAALMAEMDAYIGIRAYANNSELSDVPQEKNHLRNELYGVPVHDKIRVAKTKWCVMRYPTASMAQQAGMSVEAFEDYYFNVCCLDYSKMDKAMDALVELMERTDKVRLTGQGTDIEFSIKGLPAIKCAGALNIPDGEVFSAPVKGSINGVISFNTPSLFEGFTYEGIRLTYKNGVLVDAVANDTERINKVFERDEGAKGVGEFAIGVNPYITTPMKDTLFDEKIAGSFHFTPGRCYEECDNGNVSQIHWDLVFIQTPEYGGGEMYFDGVLVRKDGRFVLPELEPLNPENLK